MDVGTGITIASVCGVIIAAILKVPRKKNGFITQKEFERWLAGLKQWMKSVDGNIKVIQDDIKELLKE